MSPALVPVALCPGSYTWAGVARDATAAQCPQCGGDFVPENYGPDAEGERRPVQVPAHEAPSPSDTIPSDGGTP